MTSSCKSFIPTQVTFPISAVEDWNQEANPFSLLYSNVVCAGMSPGLITRRCSNALKKGSKNKNTFWTQCETRVKNISKCRCSAVNCQLQLYEMSIPCRNQYSQMICVQEVLKLFPLLFLKDFWIFPEYLRSLCFHNDVINLFFVEYSTKRFLLCLSHPIALHVVSYNV